MNPPELLSPAGDWESLKAAVAEGADAVYFGVGTFNARQRARNFTRDELGDVVSFCHERGVRAYLAANTLVKNSELSDYFKLIEDAYASGIDAVILQELSFAKIIKETMADLEIHASTQTRLFNSYTKSFLSHIDRVILPREMSLNQVRDFKAKTGIDVEVFVQGALCFSVSGICLFSSFLGGRSANRGMCAQPCRKKYNNQFLLSTSDLCMLEHLGEIASSGVSCIKIEGRLRSPEYVGAATAAYRHALDTGTVDEDALTDMKLAFSRQYTIGALFKEYDVVTPHAAGKRGIYLGKLGKDGFVTAEVDLRVGDGLGIQTKKAMHGDIIRSIIYNGKSVKKALVGQKVQLQLNAKAGDTLFLTSGEQRRKTHTRKHRDKLVVERVAKHLSVPTIPTNKFTDTKLLVKVYTKEDGLAALAAGADNVYYNIFAKDYTCDLDPYIPGCLSEYNAQVAISLVKQSNAKSALCSDLGVATQLPDVELYLDISANAFNDIDIAYYNNLGIIPTVSPELSFDEISKFSDKRFAVYAHGRLPLMSTKYGLDTETLTDEKGYTFPIRKQIDCKQIVNSVPLGIYSKMANLGVSRFLLDLDEDVGETVSIYKRILLGESIKKPSGYTMGNYTKGVI